MKLLLADWLHSILAYHKPCECEIDIGTPSSFDSLASSSIAATSTQDATTTTTTGIWEHEGQGCLRIVTEHALEVCLVLRRKSNFTVLSAGCPGWAILPGRCCKSATPHGGAQGKFSLKR
ncbi:hypothetical protein RIF29_23135 [Crotalaria pallida]|uniref:Uncharacterized protein n=1 Tax=Crotalaria pallida TaxID=3830 RepID=A0AAN9FAF3_CROPI